MQLYSKEFNDELLNNINLFFSPKNGHNFPIVLWGNPENFQNNFISEFINSQNDTILLNNDCENPYNIQIPLEPLLNPLKKYMEESHFLSKIDKKGIRSLNSAFNVDYQIDSLFKKYYSFYGFKHKRRRSDGVG